MDYGRILNPMYFEITIDQQHTIACDAIAIHTGLSKTRVKQAMLKGAVWLKPPKGRMRRIRRAKMTLCRGDRIAVHYDPRILDVLPPKATCVEMYDQYSIWFKPAGLTTQGSRFGDHCSLLHQVEQHFQSKRKIFLVHRLDRETAGLIIVTHGAKAAALFSKLFRDRAVDKGYMAWLKGHLNSGGACPSIALDLDGKPALTEYESLRYEPETHQTLVRVRIHTGRFHQIRRHFEMIGHPVMGDPRYGRNNKNQKGLQLVAYSLEFQCPFGRGRIKRQLDPEELKLL